MKQSVLCENLSKIYDGQGIPIAALSNVSLEIEKGAFVSLHGPSGSGKTTLLNLIGGLDTPSSGMITVDGQRIDQMDKAQLCEMRLRHIGFIFQAYNLLPVLSAQENVEFVMQLRGMPQQERAEKARNILKEVGLEGMEDRRPGQLSGGQQQRVAIARAVVTDPGLVLADEPTANLDSKTAKSLLELMLKMNQEKAVTFIFSTHDKLVMEYAKRLIGLQDGKIVSDTKLA